MFHSRGKTTQQTGFQNFKFSLCQDTLVFSGSEVLKFSISIKPSLAFLGFLIPLLGNSFKEFILVGEHCLQIETEVGLGFFLG